MKKLKTFLVLRKTRVHYEAKLVYFKAKYAEAPPKARGLPKAYARTYVHRYTKKEIFRNALTNSRSYTRAKAFTV